MNCVLMAATPRQLKDDQELTAVARAIAFHFVQDLARFAAHRPPDARLTIRFLFAVEMDDPLEAAPSSKR